MSLSSFDIIRWLQGRRRPLLDRVRALREDLVMVTLRPDGPCQRTPEINACLEATDDEAEVISRQPAQFLTSPFIHIHSPDAGKHLPIQAAVYVLILRNALPHHRGRIDAQPFKIVPPKGRSRADDIFPETKIGRTFSGQQMGAHHILDIDTPVQILVRLHILIRKGLPYFVVVILLRKESRRPEHDARETLIAMEQLTKILGGSLR